MPCIYKIEEIDYSLAVWEVRESEAELLSQASLQVVDLMRLKDFTVLRRRLEFIACRCLLNDLLGEKNNSIQYTSEGKPILRNNDMHVSFAHSREYVAAIVSKFNTGIDIEKTGAAESFGRIQSVAHKFMNENEKVFVEEICGEKEKVFAEKMNTRIKYLIWSAKECMFKMYSLGELDFRKHMEVLPFKYDEKGVMQARLVKGDFTCVYHLNYELREEWILVFSLERA